MSLIYDYLKIDGQSDPEGDSAVEIPPVLKRSDSTRHTRSDSSRYTSRTLFVVLGSCLVVGLFLFAAVKIFIPEEDMQVAVDSGLQPTMQVRTAPAPLPAEAGAVVQQIEQSSPAPVTGIPSPVSDSPLLQQENIVSEKAMQVFPEPPKSFIAEADSIQMNQDAAAWQSATVREKVPQTLEPGNRTRQRTFPEETPTYTAIEIPGENIQDFPFPGDVVVQEAYQDSNSQNNVIEVSSREIKKSSSVAKRSYSSPQPDPISLNKSKQFYQAGLHAQQSGDQRTAEIYYTKALGELPQHMEAMINLSALYVQQQRYAEAEEVLADILKIDAGNSKALVNMGVINLYKYNEDLAEKQFRAALDANPVEENALVNLAYLAEKKSDYISTEGYYKQLLQISPDNLVVLLAYGHLLEEVNRYPEAIALYGDCLELDSVKKDHQLYDKVKQRMRLLARNTRN